MYSTAIWDRMTPTADLYELIRELTIDRTATHRQMVNPDGTPVISPLSDEWPVLAARHAELCEKIDAAYDELARRDA